MTDYKILYIIIIRIYLFLFTLLFILSLFFFGQYYSLTLLAFRSFATSYGATDTHRHRLANEGSYKKRRFGEVNDNPLYRLPENPHGGHRLDGKSSQENRRESLTHAH